MKTVLIALALALYAQAFSQNIYQAGSGVGVFSSKSHVLLANSDVGRSVDIEIQFEKPFDTQPKVALATSLIDMEAGAPNGYTTELVFVNEKGFKIRSQALSEKKIASLSYNWFATNDPQIHVEYVRTKDMGELSNDQAEGAREHSISVPIVHWAGESPIVASFLMGVEFAENGQSLSFKQSVIEVGETNFKILMESAPGSASVKDAKFCVVFSSQEHSYNTGELGLKAKRDHPWLTRESGDSNVDVQFDVPSDLPQGQRVHLQGITGFDVSGEVRVVVNDIVEKDNVAHLSYGTWGDSKLQELNYEAFYFSAEDTKIFDKDCSEVFSECNFGGISMKVCDSMKKLDEFTYPIKSVHVPAGKSISLYNQQGLTGQKVKFTESVECLDMNAILLGEDSEEGVDLYEQEEYLDFSEEGSEYSSLSLGEESSEDDIEGEESSSSVSDSEGEGYVVSSEGGEDGLEAVEKMHLLIGEEDNISFSDSEESGSYSTSDAESEEGESASSYASEYSEEGAYDVDGEEGLEAVEKMHLLIGEEDIISFSDSEESGSYSTSDVESEEGESSSSSSSEYSEEGAYDVDGEIGEDGLETVEKMHIFLGEEDSISYEDSDDNVSFSGEESSSSFEGEDYDSSEESSEGYSSSSDSEESGYDIESDEEGSSVGEEVEKADE